MFWVSVVLHIPVFAMRVGKLGMSCEKALVALPPSLLLLCVCVCEREGGGEIEIDRERERERKSVLSG